MNELYSQSLDIGLNSQKNYLIYASIVVLCHDMACVLSANGFGLICSRARPNIFRFSFRYRNTQLNNRIEYNRNKMKWKEKKMRWHKTKITKTTECAPDIRRRPYRHHTLSPIAYYSVRKMFWLWKCSVESGTVGCNHVRRERESEWHTHASPSSTHGIDCGKTLFPFVLKLVRREASVVLSSSRFNKYSHMHIERTFGIAHTHEEREKW